MKKCIFFISVIILVFINAAVIPADTGTPGVKAAGAILMDYGSGRVLWARNAHLPLAMASTTKIMTAVMALEKGNLDDTVTVSRRASLAPKVNMSLKEGERIKLSDLLYALMLQSSNDAAVAIAEHIGGGVEEFCADMTARAKEIGAADTVFETPNGLDKGEHHSTAYDLAVITRYALGNPEFVRIINTPSVTAVSSVTTHNITNKNRLLHEFEGANGVKTGFTGKAGHCFVGSAKRGDIHLISVVLASGWGNNGREQKWRDTKEILDFGFNNFKYEEIVKKGDEAGSLRIERSRTSEVSLYFKDNFTAAVSPDEKERIAVIAEYPQSVKAPVKKDEWIGIAKVYLDGQLLCEINLCSLDGAARHDLKTSAEKVINSFLKMGTNKDINTALPEF